MIIGKAGLGLAVETLRIKFEVTKTVEEAPNNAIIKIYNLTPTHEAQIKDEYDAVSLAVGHDGDTSLIFRGTIMHVFRYREGNDHITEIEAGDGDKDYRQATMNETLAAGTTNAQLVDRAIGSMPGTSKGHIQAGGPVRRRGKVVSGNTRAVLRDVATELGANWSIQDGQVQIVSANDVLPGQAIVIRSDTGMLGAPEINDRGIAVKVLLNPQLRINGAIELDNNRIKAKRQKAQTLAVPREKTETNPVHPIRLDPDGVYKILRLVHTGDTRGVAWTSEIECIGLDQSIPKARVASDG